MDTRHHRYVMQLPEPMIRHIQKAPTHKVAWAIEQLIAIGVSAKEVTPDVFDALVGTYA